MEGEGREPQAQLWVGPAEQVHHRLVAYLERFLSRYYATGCSCNEIAHGTSHAVVWVAPEKQIYRRADLVPCFDMVQYARGAEEPRVAVVRHADYLTQACANSMLKMLEEPPTGCYLVLTAEVYQSVVSTVVSRCVVQQCGAYEADQQHEELVGLFTQPDTQKHAAVILQLNSLKLSSHETRAVCDAIITFWSRAYMSASQKGDHTDMRRAESMLASVRYAMRSLPAPGSAKYFWRNLYMMTRRHLT